MFKTLILVVSAAGLLGACTDRWNVESTKAIPLQGSAFTRALHTEYVEMAAAEKAEYDWKDTAYFLRRAEAAARGEVIQPQPIEERNLTPDAARELGMARKELVALLDAGARDTMPVKAARAQAAGFDCWMQEQEEGHQPDDIALLEAQIARSKMCLVVMLTCQRLNTTFDSLTDLRAVGQRTRDGRGRNTSEFGNIG